MTGSLRKIFCYLFHFFSYCLLFPPQFSIYLPYSIFSLLFLCLSSFKVCLFLCDYQIIFFLHYFMFITICFRLCKVCFYFLSVPSFVSFHCTRLPSCLKLYYDLNYNLGYISQPLLIKRNNFSTCLFAFSSFKLVLLYRPRIMLQ